MTKRKPKLFQIMTPRVLLLMVAFTTSLFLHVKAAAQSESASITKNYPKLMVGKWQGGRHLNQFLPNHTRLMDDVNLNPPRTWHLKGNSLSETEPGTGTTTYKIISLDKAELVIESKEGKRYTLKRVD